MNKKNFSPFFKWNACAGKINKTIFFSDLFQNIVLDPF